MEQIERKREEFGIVLDFLQNGYPFDKRPSHIKTSIAHALGTTKLALLELVRRKTHSYSRLNGSTSAMKRLLAPRSTT